MVSHTDPYNQVLGPYGSTHCNTLQHTPTHCNTITDPYNQALGLYGSVLVSLLSFGLLAPTILHYRRPPRAEVLRSPTQKMRIPLDSAALFAKRGEEDQASHHKEAFDRIFMQLQRAQGLDPIRPKDLEKLGEGADGDAISWREKYSLFFIAPVTLFVVDALLQVALMKCVAVCCSVVQCVAVRCSVL